MVIWYQGKGVVAALPYLEESLALYEESGRAAHIAIVLNSLGIVKCYQRDYVAARSYLEESLRLMRMSPFQLMVAYFLENLGVVALKQGQYQEAFRHLEESLKIELEKRDQTGIPSNLVGQAALLVELYSRGRLVCSRLLMRAAELCGVGSNLLKVTGARFDPLAQELYEEVVSIAQGELEEAAFKASFEEGQQRNWEEVAQELLKMSWSGLGE
jgi:tetratricopeptide (TPR) repeat protein